MPSKHLFAQLEAAARGNDPNSVVPSGIKPLNLIEAAEYKKPLDASLYLRTTSGLIGYSKADKREKSEMAELQRQARPQGDIRKSFGWPPDAD